MMGKFPDLIPSTNFPEGPVTAPKSNIFNVEAYSQMSIGRGDYCAAI
jgi:hypothetical protein